MHAPQFKLSLVVLVSQPLTALPSQSAKPAEQAKPHAPAMHVALALAAPPHTMPQPLQLLTSVSLLTSQPLARMPSQSRRLPTPSVVTVTRAKELASSAVLPGPSQCWPFCAELTMKVLTAPV